jgi:hypothetical protein
MRRATAVARSSDAENTPPRQPIAAVVGKAHRLVVIVVADDDEDWAEDLLLGDRHGVVNSHEQRRFDVPALGQMGRSPTPEDEVGPFVLAPGDVAEDAITLLLTHQGAHEHCWILWIAVRHGGHGLADQFEPLVVA